MDSEFVSVKCCPKASIIFSLLLDTFQHLSIRAVVYLRGWLLTQCHSFLSCMEWRCRDLNSGPADFFLVPNYDHFSVFPECLGLDRLCRLNHPPPIFYSNRNCRAKSIWVRSAYPRPMYLKPLQEPLHQEERSTLHRYHRLHLMVATLFR